MKSLSIFLFEWKHFVRSPFKVAAFLLFVVASVYGLHNGASLYESRKAEIEKINQVIEQDREENITFYEAGEKGPKDKPWVNLNTPFWATLLSKTYKFKTPSSALVYSTGESEQYGFYKQIDIWASTMDSDMTKEIANPERLQVGTLDFSFALLYLLPLLLMILLYNIRSSEAEQNFLTLIQVQTASVSFWLLSRVIFYLLLLNFSIVLLLIYGALLTDVFSNEGSAFWQMLFYSLLYLFFWGIIYYLILRKGARIMNNTLKMVGIWLLLTIIVPAISLQWITIKKPVNLMTDFINASRDETRDLYDLSDSVLLGKLDVLYPEELKGSEEERKVKIGKIKRVAFSALSNEILKERIASIEANNEIKNQKVRATYLFNPVIFFQNKFNKLSCSHYDNYRQFREEIQCLIDKQIQLVLFDTWKGVHVDKTKYIYYTKELVKNN
ncbi:MAG: hypothetical protein MK105_00315 [Crocinitomicaceae bacterium]|nr:hypothetical protein [Crocinitomicaceae bacterium]